MSLKYVARLTTYLDLESLEIQRSGFDFKSNLTSAIGNLENSNIQRDMFPAIMPLPIFIISKKDSTVRTRSVIGHGIKTGNIAC